MASVSSSLENEAQKRKERLLMMKRKMEKQAADDGTPKDDNVADMDENVPKKITFRSYNPADESLTKEAVMGPQAEPVDLDEHVKDQIEAAKDVTVVEEIDLTTLAPRKIDWDLKRDVDKKLQKLERRTQRAIAEIIRERLASGNEDLLTAVNSSARAAEDRHLSDEED